MTALKPEEREKGHTPGPWKVCDRAPNDSWFVGSTIFSVPYGRRVADVAGIVEGPTPDSSLIAAAPTMLAALERALPFIINEGSPGGCTGTFYENCDHCAAIKAVQDAIAEARRLAHPRPADRRRSLSEADALSDLR